MTDGEWLTYIEVAERLGTTIEAVRAMARHGGWPKQRVNGIGPVVRVQVPADLLTNGRPLATTKGRALATTGEATIGLPLVVRAEIETAVEGMVEPLREELVRANQRAERAERAAAVLRAKLIAARLAGEIVRGEMAGLREQLDRMTALLEGRRRWRRWRR